MAEREACADKVAQLRKDDESDSDEESSSSEYEEVEEIIEEEVEEEEQEEKTEKLELEEDSEEEISNEKHASEAVNIVKTKPKEETMRSTCSKKEEISDSAEEREVQGESLLLPLLQGLLHKNIPQPRSQISKEASNKLISCKSAGSITNSKSSAKPPQIEKLGSSHKEAIHSTHHVEDSGTESGEDLKFIAAGLRDSMQIHSHGDSDLIAEVTAALNRLEHSLKEGNDLKLEDCKKNALLTLVGRLQTGLKSPEKITAPTPAPGQTAGDDNETSSPEADARRNSRPGHQRFAKRRNRASRHTVGVSREELADARRYIEEMVMMENMSNCTTPESSAVTPPEFVSPFEKPQVKPDTQESSTLYRPNQFVPSHLKDSQINNFNNQPVQMRDRKQPKNLAMRQSADLEQTNPLPVSGEQKGQRPLSESYDYNQSQALPNYQSPRQDVCQPNIPENYQTVSEHEEEVHERNVYNKIHHSPQQAYDPVFNGLRPSAYTTDNAEANKQNRFVNKKLLMKRANTIDIPKPMKYLHDMESDSEAEERGISSTKSIGLRGTVQVSVNSKPRQVVPPFKPKTENDHKFLAFIQKQSPSHGLGWNNPNRTVTNWSNKFGNIKNAFESGAVATSGKPPVPSNTARNFWKKAEITPSQNEKVVKPPWAERGGDVLAGALKAKQKLERMEAPGPKAEPINQFSHAPMSAFKPVEPAPVYQAQFQPITPPPHPSVTSWPVFSNPPQITPNKSVYNGRTLTSSSPTSGLPWATNPNGDHRVLNMAVSKFESKSPTVGVQRHGSLREQDYIHQQRIASCNEPKMDRKRSSLPNATQYNPEAVGSSMTHNYQNTPYSEPRAGPHPQTYICTNFTDPSISTFYQREREDSLTNPQSEPLILTSSRPIISPNISATQPQQPLKIFDYPSSPESLNQTLNDITDDELDNNSLREYKAEAKVMQGPVGQQATVTSRTNHVNDEKFGRNSKAANNLLLVMKNISNGKSPERKQSIPDTKQTIQSCISPDGSSYHAPNVEPIFPSLNSAPTNRMPEYIPKSVNNIPYQSQQFVQSNTGSRGPQPLTTQSQIIPSIARGNQSLPLTPQSKIIPGTPKSTQSQPSTPQSQGIPDLARGIQSQKSISSQTVQNGSKGLQFQPTVPPNQIVTGGYHPPSSGFKSPNVQSVQPQSIPYQSQPPIHYLPGRQMSQPTTPHSPQYPNGFSQNPIYVPQSPEICKPLIPSKPLSQQTMASSGAVQYQQAQYRQQQNIQQCSQQSQLYQTQCQLQSAEPIPQQKQDQKPEAAMTQNVPQKPSKSQSDYSKPKEPQKPQQSPIISYEQNKKSTKPTPPVSSKVSKTVSQTAVQKTISQVQNQTTSKIGLKRQQATETSYKEKKKEIEASSKSSSTNQMVTTSSTTVQKKVSVNEETQVYKSSAPEDTPDIVKSSLSKENFPILKKFGPPQRHCYMPNAYQNPLSKSGSTVNARVGQSIPTSRKFSEPSVVTKFVAPEIIETPSTPIAAKDEIPSNIVFKNIAQFTSMARRSFDSVETTSSSKFASVNARCSPLSKSDSWHQIVQQQNSQKPPSPKSFAYPEGNPLRRVKSGHTLAIPKMFEAGIDKKEVVEKQKTVAAYFSGQKSPNSLSRNSSQTNIAEMVESATKATTSVSVRKSTINRVKTTEKTSIANPTTGLCRSQTMPHIGALNLLDESNVDDAFEQLLNAS